MRKTRMALWEAPMTATRLGVFDGSIVVSRGGFSAMSRLTSFTVVTGRGKVVGDEPVHKTRSSDETASGHLPFVESTVTLHLPHCRTMLVPVVPARYVVVAAEKPGSAYL